MVAINTEKKKLNSRNKSTILVNEAEIRKNDLVRNFDGKKSPFLNDKWFINVYSDEIKEIQENWDKGDKNSISSKKRVCAAGRIISKRVHGQAFFMNLRDSRGDFQIFARKPEVGEKFDVLKKAYQGDIIGVDGSFMVTETNVVTVRVKKFRVLSKCIMAWPDKFHGLSEVEERYRKRYLDLACNADVRSRFVTRSQIVWEIRKFLNSKNYMEVETNILEEVAGGAAARPFKTFHNGLQRDLVLRVAPELNLKKLIIGGFDKVYEIGRVFRNEGIDSTHNPEFTITEIYAAFQNVNYMMMLTKKLFFHLEKKVEKVSRKARRLIHHVNAWKRVNLIDLIEKETGINFLREKDIKIWRNLARKYKLDISSNLVTSAGIANLIFDKVVCKKIKFPTFVFGYPIETSPLAKRSKKNPDIADRFELFIEGEEYANAFSELNDPIDQAHRFEFQDRGNEVNQEFVNALKYAMPPAAGLGIGIDRLVMFFTSSPTIREVIFFPTLREPSKYVIK